MQMSDADVAFQSYGRCCVNEQFFEDFYSFFMQKSDEIRAMFDNTDMPEQRRLLRAGISWLLMHARGAPGGKLRHLGETHNRNGYAVKPSWYALWIDALMEAVSRHDPKYSPELELSWRASLRPGIDLMREVY